MFQGNGATGKKDYTKVSLDDFSEDDDSDIGDEGDFVQQSIRNQQVRANGLRNIAFDTVLSKCFCIKIFGHGNIAGSQLFFWMLVDCFLLAFNPFSFPCIFDRHIIYTLYNKSIHKYGNIGRIGTTK
jgi:hypothetical protein